MRVLLSWLRELTGIESAEAISLRLTMAGLEVEGMERLDAGLDKVVVGEVRAKEPIAGTKLNVCRVFDGTRELQIVCGAQNYDVGAHVPLAHVGAVLPGDKKIGQAKLRGIDSFGMLCSGAELGADDGVDGLLLLSPETLPGTPIAEVLGRNDVALEINVTPNRGDALSHVGVARDLAALFHTPLHVPAPVIADGPGDNPATIRIDAPDRCTRFASRVIEGVKVGPSPAWLARRLQSLGQRPINNVVDATNYVLFELGQPLHAYDADKVSGSTLIARLASPEEKLRTLDGKDRELTADDLVIADLKGPVALAGVMGGEDSEVKPGTTRLLLESAWFAPSTVRRTARRYGLHSDASHRFERGVDAEGTRRALDRLTEIILKTAGGEVRGAPIDVVARPWERARIPLRHRRLNALLGAEIPWTTATRILSELGLEKIHVTEEEAEFEIPGFRNDLVMEVDLIEEVARIHGFEAIAPKVLSGAGTEAHEETATAAEKRLRTALAAAGFDEASNFAFVDPRDLELLRPDVRPIALRNPLVQDQSVMRTTLLAGLLRNVGHNLRHGVGSLRLYETGRVYLPLTSPPHAKPGDATFEVDQEPRRLALVAVGPRGKNWTGGHEPLDFYDLKGAVEDVIEGLGLASRVTWTRATGVPWLHPRSATELPGFGVLGEIHPALADAFDVPRGLIVAELDLDALLSQARLVPEYKGLPRFPASLRDVAIVVDEPVTAAEVLAELRRADESHLVEDATIFDVYRGAPLPAGKKNLAFSLRIRASERTLTDEEVNALHASIVQRLQAAFGASLRA
jgi:phenylalanyl-tRNA synthetase beta chain